MFPRARAGAICLLLLVLFLSSTIGAGAAPVVSTQPSPVPTPTRSGAPDQSQPSIPQDSAATGAPAGPFTTPATLQPLAGTSTNSAGLTREVFGFATAGSLGDPTVGYPSWNFNLLSTVAFFAIRVTYTGVLVADSEWTVFDSSTMTGLITAAHQHGVKVVVTLVPLYHDLVDFCDTLYNDQTTVVQIVNQVKLKGLDGVNIDYEGQLGQCVPTNPGLVAQSDQALMTQFAKDLRAGLDAVKPGYYLSIDTYSGSAAGNDGFFNIPNLNQYVDSFFVMAYDMDESNQRSAPLTCSGFCMAPVSPMANYQWNDTTSMTQYSSVVGPGKVILGQPYYGRVACVASPVAHAVALSYSSTDPRRLMPATYLGAAAAISSSDVKPGTYAVHRDADDPAGADRWDTWYDNTLGCWREMYWADTTTLGVRYDLVNQDNLRGVGFWTLNYGGGSGELWTALQGHFMGCSSVVLGGSPASPVPGATPVAITASSTCPDPSPLYEFWLLSPGASLYTLAQAYSTNPVLNWNTSGLAPGVYRINVWVRDANFAGIYGNSYGRWDAYDAHLTYKLTSTPCSAVTESASPANSVMSGVAVNITGTTTGCAGPLYEFWVLAPGASLYKQAQAYSTNAVLDWSTSGLALGTYRINVWVRDTSSWGTHGNSWGRWDAYYANLLITVAAGCPSVSQAAAPPTSSPAGTAVTITAAAPGCANPQYEFWVLAPGASLYTLAQAYGPSATLNWNTTGLAKGTYRINVWVKDSSSAGVYGNAYGRWDTYNAGLTYSLS